MTRTRLTDTPVEHDASEALCRNGDERLWTYSDGMTLAGFKAQNHPQQTRKRDALDDVDDRGTTWEMFAPLDARFRFTIDVAAADHNAKVSTYYTRQENGL